MGEEDNRNRWLKSLNEAGFLDEIEHEWTLEYSDTPDGATIVVNGKSAEEDDAREESAHLEKTAEESLSHDEDAPVAVGTPLALGTSYTSGESFDLPQTPVRVTASTLPPYYESDLLGRNLEEVELSFRERERISRGSIEDPAPTLDAPSVLDNEPAARRDTDKGLDLVKGRALEVSSDHGIESSPDDRTAMRRSFDLGDYTGSLELAEKILAQNGEDREVSEVAEDCRRTLMQMYESRIGAFDRVPVHAITPEEIIWRNLDADTGFVLSRVDGLVSFEDIIDISGLPRFETCRILSQLLQDGIIK